MIPPLEKEEMMSPVRRALAGPADAAELAALTSAYPAASIHVANRSGNWPQLYRRGIVEARLAVDRDAPDNSERDGWQGGSEKA